MITTTTVTTINKNQLLGNLKSEAEKLLMGKGCSSPFRKSSTRIAADLHANDINPDATQVIWNMASRFAVELMRRHDISLMPDFVSDAIANSKLFMERNRAGDISPLTDDEKVFIVLAMAEHIDLVW